MAGALSTSLALSAVTTLSSPVAASGGGDGCNPAISQPWRNVNDYPHTRVTGWYTGELSGNETGGSEVSLLNYSPWVFQVPGLTDASVSAAWTMIDVELFPSETFAQDGWLEYPNGNRHNFWEYGVEGDYTFDDNLSPSPINNYTEYKTLYNPSTGNITFDIGSSQTVVFGGFTPNEAQQGTETKDLHDQLAGGYDNPEIFGSAEAYWDGGWHPMNGTLHNAYSSAYGVGKVDNQLMTTWDRACEY
jgi:hypothetical protein